MTTLALSQAAARLTVANTSSRSVSPSLNGTVDPSKITSNAKLTGNQAALLKPKDGFTPSAATRLTLSPIPISVANIVQSAPALPQLAMDTLSAADRAAVQQAASGAQGRSVQDNLRKLAESDAFRGADARTQKKALETFLAGPPSSARAAEKLTALLGNAHFRGMNTEEQAQVMDVFQKTSDEGRQHLLDLTQRTFVGFGEMLRNVGKPHKPDDYGHSALLDKDKNGSTLLSNLHAIATGKLDPSLEANGVHREDLLSSIMQEASRPGEINQSSKGTCTVTSMQYMLCKEDPAEYVRLMRGLLSPSGEVKMRNGDTLKRDAGSVPSDTAWDRSASERIFQAAMMEYSNGKLNYDNGTDKSTGKENVFLWIDKKVNKGGLNGGEQERGLQALFGRDFKQFTGLTPKMSVDVLKKFSGQNVLMDLKWGDGGHAVTFTKIEGDRVYFRNPWGATGDAKGTAYDHPPRRLEDPATRLESMSLKDFEKVFKRAFLPA
jgi:hypothetical protein